MFVSRQMEGKQGMETWFFAGTGIVCRDYVYAHFAGSLCLGRSLGVSTARGQTIPVTEEVCTVTDWLHGAADSLCVTCNLRWLLFWDSDGGGVASAVSVHKKRWDGTPVACMEVITAAVVPAGIRWKEKRKTAF